MPIRVCPSCLPLVCLISALAAMPADAAWSTNPGSAVYFDNPIGNVANFTSCSDGAGGVFAAWSGISTNQYLYAQHLAADGSNAPGWPASGIVICNTGSAKYVSEMIADGHGGFFITWHENRATDDNLYVQHINSAGVPVSGWPALGQSFSGGGNTDYDGHLVLDGAGGVFVVWTYIFTSSTDYDVYAARVTAGDTLRFMESVDNNFGIQDWPRVCSDGAGGFYVVYENNVSGSYNITAAHVGPLGVILAGPADMVNAAADQTRPAIVADGTGGFLFAYQDATSGFAQDDIYAEHVDVNLTPLWGGGSGKVIRVAPGYQNNPKICTDGQNGAFIVWNDPSGVMATHVRASGLIASGWPAGGEFVGNGFDVSSTDDGAGGVILGWLNNYEVYAQRLDAYGSAAPGWPYGGTLVFTTPYQESMVITMPDGANGAILAWDQYSISSPNYSQFSIEGNRIDKNGALGDATPHLVGVKDVPDDQGGKVRVAWNATYLDAGPDFPIADYRVWQQVPAAQAARALRTRRLRAMSDASLEVGDLAQASGFFWSYAGSVPASGYPSYSFLGSTTGDSTGTGNPRSVFKVQARLASNLLAMWDSAPDSGYSVDNLPPVAPAPFSATYVAGNGSFLSWGPNAEPDLAGYRLYRGGGLNFTPTPANRIYDGTLTSYHDGAPTPYIYKVCAYDVHGNQGPCSTAQSPGTTAADDAVPKELVLLAPAPNPARGGTVLRLGLPRAGRVDLAIYDALGRRVKTLLAGDSGAGWLETRWDGGADSGARARSGLYWVRAEAGGRRIIQRFVMLE